MCLACQKPTRSLRHRIRFGQGRKGRQRQRNSDQERQGEYLHYLHYLHYLIIEFVVSFQVRMELGIADHVWQQTRATIALTVDSLSDDFRPLIRAGWLAYINKTCIMFINYIICIIVLICVICIICIRRTSMWILLETNSGHPFSIIPSCRNRTVILLPSCSNPFGSIAMCELSRHVIVINIRSTLRIGSDTEYRM